MSEPTIAEVIDRGGQIKILEKDIKKLKEKIEKNTKAIKQTIRKKAQTPRRSDDDETLLRNKLKQNIIYKRQLQRSIKKLENKKNLEDCRGAGGESKGGESQCLRDAARISEMLAEAIPDGMSKEELEAELKNLEDEYIEEDDDTAPPGGEGEGGGESKSEGEAKKEDGFNVNTWPRPEGSLCSSPDEIWELNNDGKLKISLTSFESDIKSNDQNLGQVRGAPVENLWKKIMKSAGLPERQGISSDLLTSVRKNNAAVRLLGFEADLKKIFKNILDDPAKPNWDDYKARIYLLNNETILKYKKEICLHSWPPAPTFSDNLHEALFGTDNKKSLYDEQEASQIAERLAAQKQAEQKRREENPGSSGGSSALTEAATVALPTGAAAAAAEKEAEAKKAADDKAAADAAADAYESKKYTMTIERIKQKIKIFSTPPTTTTDRTKLWGLFTTNRESLKKYQDKIKKFYNKLESIYKKYNNNLKNNIVNFNPHLQGSMKPQDAAREIYTFINSESKPPPEKEDVEQMVKDLNRSSDTFTNSLTTVIDNSKNLFEKFSKPLLIIYTKFMYDVLTDEDRNIKDMPVLSTQTPEEKNKKRKEYSLLYWAQSDINIFRYVMDGLFLLYKNDEIHEPDIFDIIVTIHILYNCEYGSEFRGALNNPLPSMLAYKRVRYYCDRLYPEIFDILDMSEMIEVANIPKEGEPGQYLKTPETLKTEIEKINLDAVTTIKQCETVSCPRLPKELKEGWKRSVHPESMKLLKHHMGYFRLFKNYYWSLFHSETFGMTENYIPLMFMDYKIKITGKKKDIAQEKRIFQPGLSWFKHLLKRGSNAYYWLYTSLLIALKEEFIDKCGEITCDDQPYYGSDIMTNILNTLTCEINANGQIDTKGKNYTNITQFIPRAIEIYEEMNKNGRMGAMEKEADSKLEKGKTYTTNENGKRYYTRVPDFDDELIMKRHEIKRKLVYLLIKSGNNETSPLELYKTVFNAGLNNILIPIGVPRNQIRTIKTKIPLRKTKEKESKSTNITFCSFSESELIESYYIKKFGTSVGESELKTLKRKTKRCRKKRRVNKVSRKKYITKKLEKLKKKKTKESERITKIATQEEEDKKYKQQIKKQEKQDTSNKSVKPKKKSVKPKKKGTSTFGRTGRGRAVIEMAAAITKSLR